MQFQNVWVNVSVSPLKEDIAVNVQIECFLGARDTRKLVVKVAICHLWDACFISYRTWKVFGEIAGN